MMTTLLIVHGLLAVLLLGAVTHQAFAAVWPARRPESFLARFRAVNGVSYTNAVVILFVVTFIIGGVIYPAYRLNVRTYLQDYRMFATEGAFEIKEHLTAIALALLPLYWCLWKRPHTRPLGAAVAGAGSAMDMDKAYIVARGAVTAMIALTAWSSFFIGHILNNVRGLFGT